jgi:hypothetical protein
MPTILVIDGFAVRMHGPPREHGPPHVHVWKAGTEVIIELGHHGEALCKSGESTMDKAPRRLTDAEITAQIRAARARTRRLAQTEPRGKRARYDRETGLVTVELTSGAFFGFPARSSAWLRNATDDDLTNVEVSPGGDGLRWDSLDADFSVPGLIHGVFGPFGSKTWMRELGRTGGSSRSPAKVRAARANGKKGGRPRKRAAKV